MNRSTLLAPSPVDAAAYRVKLRRNRFDRAWRSILLRVEAAVVVGLVVASSLLVIGIGYAAVIAVMKLAVAVADVVGTI